MNVDSVLLTYCQQALEALLLSRFDQSEQHFSSQGLGQKE